MYERTLSHPSGVNLDLNLKSNATVNQNKSITWIQNSDQCWDRIGTCGCHRPIIYYLAMVMTTQITNSATVIVLELELRLIFF